MRAETAPYPLEAFTDEPYVDAHEVHLVEMMREDLARGIAVVVPPPPAPATPAQP